MSLNANTLLREHGTMTLLVCAGLAVAAQMRGGGLVFVVFVGPAALVWLLLALIRARRVPAARPKLLVRALVLVLTAGAVWGIFQYRLHADSKAAEQLARALAEHKSRTGAYPATLGEAGEHVKAMADRLDARYRSDARKPFLDHGDAWDLWKRHQYDFNAGRWTAIIND